MNRFAFLMMLVVAMLCQAENDAPQAPLTSIASLEVHPAEFTLTGRRERQQLIVVGTGQGDANGKSLRRNDLTQSAKFVIDNPQVIEIDARGRVVPLADGVATIKVLAGGKTATCQVTATNIALPQPVSFDLHVLPVLTQSGCSGGSCHGAPHGKAGFRLSLFGSDRQLDRHSLTRELFSRRVNPLEPAKSLLLRKPTAEIAHQGGKRFDKTDLQYKLIHDWIQEGCRVDSPPTNDLASSEASAEKSVQLSEDCVGIDVFPSEGLVRYFPDASQQLSVMARFADGSRRDVTHLAKYEVSDPLAAQVSQEGFVKGIDRGQSAIIVRYAGYIETPLMTLVREIQGFAWNNPPEANYIDTHVNAKLRQLQFEPAPKCDDRTFIRRAFLDAIGLLPEPSDIDAFLAEPEDTRRKWLIDHLLERKEMAKFWAQKWGDLLRVSTKLIGTSSTYKFSRWLEASISANKPYDEFAREILLATGSTRQHPAGNFYRAAGDTNDATETAAQVFLGTRIQCAKCHNHPFERWTQANYYGLSAFFNRLQRSKTPQNEEVFLWSSDSGEVTLPSNGEVATPWVPSDGHIQASGADRRESFARWLTSHENKLFAKIEVNRIWTQLMGRGIVEPFDDFRDSNPPANSPLLDALADDFIKSGYDRQHMIRVILESNTYQASSDTNDLNHDDNKFFSHYMPRMLTAEQLVDALGFVTDKPQRFFGVPEATKATWLPAPDLKPHDRAKIGDIEFLKVFGQPERQSACECERSSDVSLGQALELLNGKMLTEMLSDKSNFLHQAEADGKQPIQIVRDLYVRALARLPTSAEVAVHEKYLRAAEDKSKALEDLCWALVNRNEFLFQH